MQNIEIQHDIKIQLVVIGDLTRRFTFFVEYDDLNRAARLGLTLSYLDLINLEPVFVRFKRELEQIVGEDLQGQWKYIKENESFH